MTTQSLHISPAGLELIKKHESLRLRAYLCPSNKLTIGYGHVIQPQWDFVAFKAMTSHSLTQLKLACERRKTLTNDANACLFINPTQAAAFLNGDTRQVAEFIKSTTHVELNQNQFDALCSFVFDIGQGAFAGSTLRELLNAGDYKGAADQFERLNKGIVNGTKQVLKGLSLRRQAERLLFTTS